MEVLIITGAPGVGKSTLAKAWAKKHAGIMIPVDYLSNWVYDPSFPKWNEEAERFLARLAGMMSIEYLSKELPVVVDYVWTPIGINIITELINEIDGVICKAVYVTCSAEENRRRDALRIPNHQMGKRVDVVRKELNACDWGAEVQIVDSTFLSVGDLMELLSNS